MNCWIIAAACCLINFLVLGTARLAPLLFVASMERYNVNRVKASLPYVLCYVLRTLPGPLIGFVGNKFGLKAVTLFGCFASFIGIGACYFAEDIIAVTILWGGFYGFGFGFGSALLPLVLDRTFDKNKTKANGIALAGSSLGAIVMPPIIQASIEEYGLSGSFLIISGMILHCVPAAMLLSVSNSKNASSTFGNKESQRNGKLYSAENGGQDINTKNTNSEGQNMNSTKNCGQDINTKNTNYGGQNINSGNCLSNAIFKQIPKSVEPPGTPRLLQISVISEHDYGSGMLYESQKYARNGGQTESKKEDKMRESAFKPFSIFVDPTFLLIMFSQSVYGFIVTIVWTIIVDVVRDKGVSRSSEIYCMMFLPLSDMIGRLSLGWITDRGYLSLTNFCVVSFLLLGLISLLFIWVYSFAVILLTIFLFSYVSGGLMAVLPSVVCEFMASHNKIMAVSSRLFLLAPLGLTTSPLIGYFREQCGSYDGMFYVVGGLCILCCGMSALIPRFSRRSKS